MDDTKELEKISMAYLEMIDEELGTPQKVNIVLSMMKDMYMVMYISAYTMTELDNLRKKKRNKKRRK